MKKWSLCLGLLIFLGGCYKSPFSLKGAVNIKVYRGKAALEHCVYINETFGSVSTKGYGISLQQAIEDAEVDLKNKAFRYGGDAVLVLHTESRYISKDYNFKVGMGSETTLNKIDEYIIYGEVYKCAK